MNHFDDRGSYFAFLRETEGPIACLDSNQQADQSLSAYGGKAGTVQLADIKADI